MKVLQINCVYPVGSTGKIVRDLHTSLQKDGHKSLVIYGRGARPTESGVYKSASEPGAKLTHLFARFSGIRYGGAPLATARLIARIRRERPDIVHLHCINGYFVNIYRLLSYLKREGIPTVLTLHAEFMFTANCDYAYDCPRYERGCGRCPRRRAATESYLFDRTAASHRRMKRAMAGFPSLVAVAVSPWSAERAARSPILEGVRLVTVKNGIDTALFTPADAKTLAALRARYTPNGERLLLHVSAAFSTERGHIKGGEYILRLAEELRGENVRILVAGDYDARITPPENLTFLGRVSDQGALAALYAAADLTVLSSRRETYSMPVAESLSCGTPVVGFMAGGPESIALPDYTTFVPYGDSDALARACREMLARELDRCEIARAGAAAYAKEEMAREYLSLYRELAKGVRGE